jgi:hypothetical protein
MSVGIFDLRCTLVQPVPTGQVELHVKDGPLDTYRDRGGIGRTGGEVPIGERDEIIAELLNTENWEAGGNYQVPFVRYLIVGCAGAGELGTGQVGTGQQLRQCQQRPWFIGSYLPVDLLEADDVGPKPEDLRPNELNPLGQRGPHTYAVSSKFSRLNVAIRTSAIERPLSPHQRAAAYLGSSEPGFREGERPSRDNVRQPRRWPPAISSALKSIINATVFPK